MEFVVVAMFLLQGGFLPVHFAGGCGPFTVLIVLLFANHEAVTGMDLASRAFQPTI